MDGVHLLSLVAAFAQPADQPSGPDSHDLRRERGDVLMVDGRPPDAGRSPRDESGPAPPCCGSGDRQVRPGQRLAPAFFGPRHAITDRGRFGLPPPGAGRRWIGCGGDAVLVSLHDGRVIEVEAGRLR